MRKILLVLLLCSCATTEIVTYRPGTTEVAATVKATALGRACIAVDQRPTTGRLSITVEQDGTSDWSVSRLLAWLGDIAGNVFGGKARSDGMEGPSSRSGCAGLFE